MKVDKFVPVSAYQLLTLAERVDYYALSPMVCRKDPKRRLVLLSLKSRDENSPLLPLPEMVTSDTDHPLLSLIKAADNPSEFSANLMGLGPWSFQMALTVPSVCGLLHFSNKNKRAPIEITHTLKLTIRAQRGDDQHLDPESGKPKQFDIVMRMPVHILSVRSYAPKGNLFALIHTVCRCLSLASVKRPEHRTPVLLRVCRCSIPFTPTSSTLRLIRGPWALSVQPTSFLCTTMCFRCTCAFRIA